MITENPVRTAFTTLDSVCVASRADGIMIVNSAGVFLLKESQRRMSMGNELQQIIGAVTPGKAAQKLKKKPDSIIRPADICVCCGAAVPEGRMICWACERKYLFEDKEDKHCKES